jgi:hypothetical protein
MEVFYYVCPECGSSLIETHVYQTLVTCLDCGFAWGPATKQSRFTSLDIITGIILAICIIAACLCAFVSMSYPIM